MPIVINYYVIISYKYFFIYFITKNLFQVVIILINVWLIKQMASIENKFDPYGIPQEVISQCQSLVYVFGKWNNLLVEVIQWCCYLNTLANIHWFYFL